MITYACRQVDEYQIDTIRDAAILLPFADIGLEYEEDEGRGLRGD